MVIQKSLVAKIRNPFKLMYCSRSASNFVPYNTRASHPRTFLRQNCPRNRWSIWRWQSRWHFFSVYRYPKSHWKNFFKRAYKTNKVYFEAAPRAQQRRSLQREPLLTSLRWTQSHCYLPLILIQKQGLDDLPLTNERDCLIFSSDRL